MTVYIGALRDQLIHDNLVSFVTDGLTALGWFNPGRRHLPITVVDDPVDTGLEIPLNTLALSDEMQTDSQAEMGTTLSDHRWVHYVDFFAQDDALGRQVTADIKALLEGRYASLGYVSNWVPIYDFTLATPVKIFAVEIDTVHLDRSHDFSHAWMRHWYSVQFVSVDTYGSDLDPPWEGP